MTMTHPIEVNCPKCGTAQQVEIYDTINATLDPSLRERLFKAEINFLVCQECEARNFIPTPLLYHDMDRAFVVQYYPEKVLDSAEFFGHFTRDGKLRLTAPPNAPKIEVPQYLTEMHIVFDPVEMLRYIQFREVLFHVIAE